MTIDEAINDLSVQMEVKRRTRADRQADAIKMGIEALEVLKEHRRIMVELGVGVLPSEAK